MADNKGTEEEQKPAAFPAPETGDEKPEHQHGPVEISEHPDKKPALKRFGHWFMAWRKWTIPGTVILLLALLAIIPATRYALAGTVLKQNFKVQVVDSQTGKPVTAATVRLKGKQVTTDNQGVATVRVSVGGGELAVSKQYYTTKNGSVTVPIGKQSKPEQVQLVATGRQVPIKLVNKISGKPVTDAVITAADTQVRTDKQGEATMVLPAGMTEQKGVISAKGYNKLDTAIKVTTDASANKFQLTPSGKIYFLSNKTGKIDVVKTDLDGSNRATVLAGTGKEDSYNTVLLASTDWKYLALLSKRDGGEYAKLFLIDTSNDQLTVMDEGAANFTLMGWSGHHFAYRVDRANYDSWKPKHQAIKSYNAEKKSIAVIDETEGSGANQYEFVRQYYSYTALSDEIYWTEDWNWGFYSTPGDGQRSTLSAAKPDGSNKRIVHDFGPSKDVSVSNMRPYDVQGLYVDAFNRQTQKHHFFEYENGKLEENKSLTLDNFYADYYTYLVSPSAKQTFWAADRDGKNSLFQGDAKGENGKEFAALTEYNSYGWYTDDYLLVSKKGSELYILPAGQDLKDKDAVLKVTDYYRQGQSFRGYGGGYGGL